MSEQGISESVEELLDLARANAQALIIATTGYLAQAGIPLNGWSDYLGTVFANSWDDSMAKNPQAFMEAVLVNYTSLGADVVSTKYEAKRAEAVISGFPNVDLCVDLAADCTLAAAYNDLGAIVAERLGLTWWWGASNGMTTLVVTDGE